MATDQVTYEIEVEKLVLNPINGIIQENIPKIEKEEKENKKNVDAFDSATALWSINNPKMKINLTNLIRAMQMVWQERKSY